MFILTQIVTNTGLAPSPQASPMKKLQRAEALGRNGGWGRRNQSTRWPGRRGHLCGYLTQAAFPLRTEKEDNALPTSPHLPRPRTLPACVPSKAACCKQAANTLTSRTDQHHGR